MGAVLIFSLTTAAIEAPDRAGLVIDGRAIAFKDLAVRARELRADVREHHPGALQPVLCRPYLPALLQVYACLEQRIPMALLSPKLTEEKERALRRSLATFRPTPATDERDQTSAMAIVFSSGSSGDPKGVELSRGAFKAAAEASEANLGWRDDDRWLLGLSFAHIGGFSILTRCLEARRPVVVVSANRFSAREVAHAIERDRVTLLSLVPTQLRQFLDLAPSWKPPSHLRAVLLGGAAASPALLAEGRERGWPLLATYGMTETCSQIATQPLTDLASATPATGISAPPLAGFEVRVVEDGIQVRSPTLLTRYQPAGSHPDPLTADGWLVTQDIGRLQPGGRVEVLGRRDDLIVTGGEKVMPLEVERALTSCPGVRAACAFGIADPVWGQLVAAAIVAAESFDLGSLPATLEARLSSHQRPRRVALVDELPLTAAGKVDRRALMRLSPEQLRPLRFS